jgi:hypothetical protein
MLSAAAVSDFVVITVGLIPAIPLKYLVLLVK